MQSWHPIQLQYFANGNPSRVAPNLSYRARGLSQVSLKTQNLNLVHITDQSSCSGIARISTCRSVSVQLVLSLHSTEFGLAGLRADELFAYYSAAPPKHRPTASSIALTQSITTELCVSSSTETSEHKGKQ